MADDKKIIVDDDWKAQARKEKEALAEQEQTAGGAAGPGQAGAAGHGGQREIPPASFSTLVSTLVTQIFMSLGGYEDPQGRRMVDLELAKHHIDTLVVLEEKTKGNLTDDEKKLLDTAIYECRMQYVQIAQRVTKI